MKVHPYDEILITSSDDEISERELSISSASRIDFSMLVHKFSQNKISCERLDFLLNKVGAEENANVLIDQIEKDKSSRSNWGEYLQFALKLLYDNNIYPMVIKFLQYPFAIMSDVDILTLDPMQELEVVELLHREKFAFFQFRLLAHPLKITARPIRPANASYGKIDLDFYPAPSWLRKRVCDSDVIFSRRTSLKKGELKIFVPSPEDDVYFVGTHAYAHLNLTLAEVLHGLTIIRNTNSFDWGYLYNSAQTYGCLDSVYLYLKFLNIYSKTFYGWPIVDEDVFGVYEESKVCRVVRSWLDSSYSNTIQFPVQIPLRLGCVRASFYRFRSLAGHVSFSDLAYDFLSHYLSLSAKSILGIT